MGATPNNIKIKVIRLGRNENYTEKYDDSNENSQAKEEQNILKPENFTINLIAKAVADNYVEFYVDGEQKKKGILPAGETLHFEASNSIQMKIGNAGAMDIIVNGKTLKRGRNGQQINRIIRKVKDPLRQLKYKLEIKDS